MSNEIVIRSASVNDAAMLAELAYVTFWDAFHEHPANRPEDMAAYMATAFSEQQVARELADERNIFFIAELDGEPAGYAKLIIGATEDDIHAVRPIELARLYSHQKFLGKGVGQALMDECFSKARELGCDVMWLGVWEFNPRARRFYEKNGFQFCGTHIFQLGSDPQTDLLMRKDL
ncbi:MAG: GNAT family N-acetyltransferase [Acidobacteria bacterium]|nr:GNAT family N-acetyltransferase [Acidobacteriota bacterium]